MNPLRKCISLVNAHALLSFVGEKVSQSCPPREDEHWATTAHAMAYQTLSGRNKTAAPTCLPCHTTCHRSPKNTNSRFEIVKCESCHGTAKDHPDSRKDLRISTKTIAGRVTIQPTVLNAIMIYACRKSFIQK